MSRPKGSKNLKEKSGFESEEVEIEVMEEAEEISVPVVVENKELKALKEIHSLMTERGIRDIGQLEVLISRLQ